MVVVKAKKNLGQHFLTDLSVARRIVDSLPANCSRVLEIGPGMGVLTQFLFQNSLLQAWAIDVDRESVAYLKERFPDHGDRLIEGDFLRFDPATLFGKEAFCVIGNFPYNISSQILFAILDYRDRVPEVVGMFQKEVAERIASPAGSKTYGITSVLMQAWYDIDYLFTVHAHVFSPPPKVKSAVIRLKRNATRELACDEKLFTRVVKTTFNQRRKMIRNSIKPLIKDDGFSHPYLERRPEQLSVQEFIELTNAIIHIQK
ncbi:MAG TPA: 16S rRNA (adenine(1518)-N(6)/adenine(1519)-N(6))-dimethyltransferase RsmA [Prolixibacteraceae bacterium]|nr:16S rRNA (adenine(1518)-N(6)/adenine(1519)-N(6))-dimethyltransferase RsmA [Prolixibacteraceae bacterium]